MNTENAVAKILKVYAVLNFVVCLIACLIVADNLRLSGIVLAIGIAASVCVNFVIYACGELIQLLHDIKENTAKAAISTPVKAPAPAQSIRLYSDELPEL